MKNWTTNRRVATLLVGGLVATTCLGGPGVFAAGTPSDASTPAESSPEVEARTIGYVTIFGDPVQQRFFRVFDAAAQAVGWNVEFVDAQGDPAEAQRAMETFLNDGVDAIVASSVETPIVRASLDEARERGIPTIAVGAIIGEPLDAWSAVYVEDEGALSRALADHMLADEEGGEVGIIYNTEYVPGVIRHDDFVAALADTSWEVVAEEVVTVSEFSDGSRRAADAMLTAHPNLKVILAIFDWMAPPAVAAIETAGRTDQVSVYSYYADDVNLPLLIDPASPLRAVVDGNVEVVSAVAVDQLLRHFVDGGELDPDAVENIDFTYTVYTVDNAPEYNDDYLGPVDLDTVLGPWVADWQERYALAS